MDEAKPGSQSGMTPLWQRAVKSGRLQLSANGTALIAPPNLGAAKRKERRKIARASRKKNR